jgi:methylated-DNA-[protein]-cysteine S-methyltransferase
MTALAHFRSPVGTLTLEASDEGLCGLSFSGAAHGLAGGARARPPISALTRQHLDAALAALADYFDGRPPRLPPLVLHGTDFELSVWRALLAIPFGETRTYGELALTLKRAGAARAVGQANHQNPVAILVPCHRVVAARGGLGGYGGGLDKKRWLLRHEAEHMPLLRPT